MVISGNGPTESTAYHPRDRLQRKMRPSTGPRSPASARVDSHSRPQRCRLQKITRRRVKSTAQPRCATRISCTRNSPLPKGSSPRASGGGAGGGRDPGCCSQGAGQIDRRWHRKDESTVTALWAGFEPAVTSRLRLRPRATASPLSNPARGRSVSWQRSLEFTSFLQRPMAASRLLNPLPQ
ncbi:hypothetical protein EV184_13521 [Sinorhizobium americanum]|uniref:Uncharacterized protein n=1 Tax=Sinorhizobium americanum TaxID=194963 RepID=A0A4R2AYW9_9HYPH|nr:hypothetical protein EV184_13521 [Sinorhizobium americanum]